MSKEMREQIDRIKNWKQFLNENIENNSNDIWFHGSDNLFTDLKLSQ